MNKDSVNKTITVTFLDISSTIINIINITVFWDVIPHTQFAVHLSSLSELKNMYPHMTE